VGIVAAAMVWLWLMQWLQTQALAQGDSTPQAIWVGTMGLTLWASGVAWVLAGLSVWRQRRRAG
jgi:hypothetical protein